jgi:predicted O-methyltransferase YrrM
MDRLSFCRITDMVEVYLLIATLAVSSSTLLLNLYLIRKARWTISALDRFGMRSSRNFRHLFRHIQIINALHEQLRLPHILPPSGGMAASPDFLKAVADHVLAAKPNLVVECSSGLSTVVIARCLQINGGGRVVSMEHMPQFAEMTRAELKRQGLSDRAVVLDAPLIPHVLSGTTFQWYRTDALPGEPIDLLIVDGPPADTGDSPRYPAGPRLFPRLSSKGAIFIDDAGRPEDIDVIARWRQEFTELIFEVNTQEFQKGICTARHITQKSPQPALQAAG